MTTVRVYTTERCQQCTLTKKLMTEQGIEFVEEDATATGNLAALKYLGYLTAPVVVAGESGDDMWAGFQPERIKALAARINGQES